MCVCVEERRQAQIFPQTMIYVGRRRALKVNNDELKKQSDCMQLKCSLWQHNNNNNNSNNNNNNSNVTSQPQRRLASTKRQQQQLLLRAIQVRNLSLTIRHTVRIFQLTRISTLLLYIVCTYTAYYIILFVYLYAYIESIQRDSASDQRVLS